MWSAAPAPRSTRSRSSRGGEMSVYDERPWLKQSPAGLPTDIEVEHETALDMFKATAARVPDGTAIHYFDSAISYREIDEITDALAVGLREQGFQPGDRLAVYLQNVPQFVMAM